MDTPELGNLHPYIADYDAQFCLSLAVVAVCERKVSLHSALLIKIISRYKGQTVLS